MRRVQVLDEQGAPREGVPVYLEHWGEVVARAESGADGLATFPGPLQSPLLVGEPIAMLEVLTDESAYAQIPSLASDPVVLRLPDVGRLEVRLTQDGSPFEGEARLTFRIYDWEDVEGDYRPPPRRLLDSVVLGPEQAPYALLVGLGLEVHVSIEADGRRETSAVLSGPTASDEPVHAAIEVGRKLCVLTGSVLDENGEPLARSRLQVSTPCGYREHLAVVETDGQGGFRVPVDLPQIHRAEDIDRLRFTVWGRPEHRLDFTIEPLVPGEVPLGVLRLEGAPRIVSGRVLDESDQPFERVGLRVLLDYGRHVPLSTDAQGLFEWRTFDATGERVVLSIPSHDQTLEVPAGTEDLEVRLARFGSVRIDLMHDPEWGTRMPLRMQLLRAGAEGKDVHRSFRDGVACFESVVPGYCSLEWFAPWCGRGGLIVGLKVRSNEETLDVRLMPLDLRFLPPAPRLRVLGEGGQALPLAYCEPVEFDLEAHLQEHLTRLGASTNDGTHATCVRVDLQGGVGSLYGDPEPLRVWAQGYRPVEIDAPQGEVTVTLQRGPPLVIELTDSFPELPQGWGWFLTIFAKGAEYGPFAELAFDGRRLETTVEEPGMYFINIDAGPEGGGLNCSFLEEFEVPAEGKTLRPVLDESNLGELQRTLERERLHRP